MRRKWRKRGPDTPKRAYQRVWWARRRAVGIFWLGSKCAQCDCTDPDKLEFDHIIAGSGPRIRWSWNWSRIFKELRKCQLLCVTCHNFKTLGEEPPF